MSSLLTAPVLAFTRSSSQMVLMSLEGSLIAGMLITGVILAMDYRHCAWGTENGTLDFSCWLLADQMEGLAVEQVANCNCPCLQVIKPDVVLTSMEALAGDAAELQQISWDLIIMDERSRARGSVSKAHAALKDFPTTSFRLLISHGLPPQACHTSQLQYFCSNLVPVLPASWLLIQVHILLQMSAIMVLWRPAAHGVMGSGPLLKSGAMFMRSTGLVSHSSVA